jgi:hypothetical protein
LSLGRSSSTDTADAVLVSVRGGSAACRGVLACGGGLRAWGDGDLPGPVGAAGAALEGPLPLLGLVLAGRPRRQLR